MREKFDCIIIGLGAAGMMAAAKAQGLNVLAIEKNEKPGAKVLISGKGQCNFTHDGTAADLSLSYGDKKNFVKQALGKFDPQMTRQYFETLDVPSVVMDNGKVFPESLNAYDLVRALMTEAKKNGVRCQFGEAVRTVKLRPSESSSTNRGFFEVTTDKGTYWSHALLIATGGQSYQVTGSTGDGYRLARMLGHTLVMPRSALAPIYHTNQALHALAGVSITDANIQLWREAKKIKAYSGDLLFTHKGLSGPVILNNSRDMASGDVLKLQLSQRGEETLQDRFIEAVKNNGKQMLKTWIREQTAAQAIAQQVILQLGFAEDLKLADVDRPLRLKVIQVLTAYPVEIQMVGDHRIAMATAGGIPTQEIKGKTLESKIVPHAYFAGELIDVDGDTGGYNIQWAFSSAVAAIQEIKNQK